MKHAAALLIAVFSMLFLMGDSCDSGDFTTSYFFCCDPTSTTCTSDSTQCPANGCSTGQQTFVNGQNECAILQTEAANNSCGLYTRFQEYINIGCTGVFTDNPPLPAPPSLTATAGAAGSATINLSWTSPPGINNVPLAYTILRGTVTGGEGFLIVVSGDTTSYQDNAGLGLVSTGVYYYQVTASLDYVSNLTLPGLPSPEATATAP